MADLKTYSLLIAWCDGDDEQGTFGSTVRAGSFEEAERKVREEMRESYIAEMGGDEEAEDMANDREDDGQFGGSVLECSEGALWKAADLENCLRGLLAQVDEFADRCGWSDHGERDAARKLIAEIDALLNRTHTGATLVGTRACR
ncbi:hypothetical protein MesoLjLc_51300 [Mesorhizobium sp. L-8-10]|uniref:hypothetical protein n=1 Tax=Mesorhizobium sp. L-8-10 TaxID=2744523 RepID=UPI00192684B6|nr:hypothetical protein [Mesorhizobium sp. L-8-10]BCH33200.1 hypothetical protein MesoLjLc_51300 [Mesorhizobium sp. L-8-10]